MTLLLLFKMSWKYTSAIIKALGRTSKKYGDKQNSHDRTRHKNLLASKNRLFRVSLMSCACLLLNTAANVSLSVALEGWSLSSDIWMTCKFETFLSHNWSNYGLNEGDRCVSTTLATVIFGFVLTTTFRFWNSPPNYDNDGRSNPPNHVFCLPERRACSPETTHPTPPEYRTAEAADRRREHIKEVCSRENAIVDGVLPWYKY